MIVSRIKGDCPKCKKTDTFGNVSVGENTVRRGCTKCTYSEILHLPELKKNILYIDQFFFSRAFRRSNPQHDDKYRVAIGKIKELANKQLLVTPYSPIHEDETHQWKGKDGKTNKQLMQYIKKTSLGHKFDRPYNIQIEQILRNFGNFRKGKSVDISVNFVSAIKDNIHQWASYLWIDIDWYYRDTQTLQEATKRDVQSLLTMFTNWRTSSRTFEQQIAIEYKEAAISYIKHFQDYLNKLDTEESLNSSVYSRIIRSMFYSFDDEVDDSMRSERIIHFFPVRTF